MEDKDLSLLHCIFFIYQTFATFSDGELVESEQDAIVHFIKRWSGEDQELTKKILEETETWAKGNVQDAKQAIEYMSSMVEFINGQEDFTIHKREILLLDLRNISRMDGVFHETERVWHDIIAQQLKIHIRISESSTNQLQTEMRSIEKREPMGFKMSFQK